MSLARPALALFVTLILGAQEGAPLKLPPAADGGQTLGAALAGRRTARALAGPGLTLKEASQLLWAAQGENRPGRRTVPSARAKYPLDLYLLTEGGEGLGAGSYLYQSAGHLLKKQGEGTPRSVLGAIHGMQPWIAAAPAVFVAAGMPARIDPSGKGQAVNWTYYEAGAAAQCLLLQAAALGLGAGTAGGVDMEALGQALRLPPGEQALILLPVGREK